MAQRARRAAPAVLSRAFGRNRGLLATAILIWAGVAAAADAPMPPLATITARYVAWRGGVAFEKGWRSWHARGSIEIGALTGAVEFWRTPTSTRISRIDLGPLSSVAVTDPHGSWSMDAAGSVVGGPDGDVDGDDDPQSGAALRGQGGAHSELVGVEVLDGRTWAVVHVAFDSGDTFDEFIDPATGELGGQRATIKGQARLERYSNWRWVGRRRFPFVTRTDVAQGNSTTVRLSSLRLDVAVDPSLFRRPRKVAASAGPPLHPTDWIPLTESALGYIVFPVQITGRMLQAELDTGVASTAIGRQAAASLGLGTRPAGLQMTGATGGSIQADLAQSFPLAIGALKFDRLRPIVIADTEIPQPVLLGEDFLAETVVEIDFEHQRIRFSNPASFHPPSGAVPLPLTPGGGLRMASVEVEDHSSVLFQIDTGGNIGLISPDYAATLGAPGDRPTGDGTIRGAGATIEIKTAYLHALRFGGVRFADVLVAFPAIWSGDYYTSDMKGVICVDLLRRFQAVVLDWPHDRMILIPKPGITPVAGAFAPPGSR